MKQHNKDGFTLVEIMIVVVIIGLLAALAIPAFTKVQQTSLKNAVLNDLRVIASAADQYFLENGATSVAVSDLDIYLHMAPTDASSYSNLVYPSDATEGTPLEVTGNTLPGGTVSLSF